MENKLSQRLCASCNKDGTLCCSSCKLIKYCSKECQKSDWILHKLVCASPDLRAPLREGMVRAILFPEDRNNIDVLWLPLTKYEGSSDVEDDDEGVSEEEMGGGEEKNKEASGMKTGDDETDVHESFQHCYDLESGKYFVPAAPGQGEKTPHFSSFKNNRLRNRMILNDNIMVWHRNNFQVDGSHATQSILNLVGGKTTAVWRGPIITVAAVYSEKAQELVYRSMNMRDVRDVVDFFLTYGSKLEYISYLGLRGAVDSIAAKDCATKCSDYARFWFLEKASREVLKKLEKVKKEKGENERQATDEKQKTTAGDADAVDTS